MFNSSAIKNHLTTTVQWAASGTKLTYASIGVALIVAAILFKMFFKGVAGFFHSIGFSVGSGGNPEVAAQPGLGTSSRLKLLLILLVPAGSGYAAFILLPKWFPTIFQ
jgi:hypothetical protein